MKKLVKQLVALNLAIVMVLCSVVTASAAEVNLTRGLLAQKIVEIMEWQYDDSMDTGEFADVPVSNPYHDAIYVCVDKRLIAGNGSVFGPDNTVPRSSLAVILVNCGLDWNWGADYIPDDVDENSSFRNYVINSLANGVMTFTSGKNFSPNALAKVSDVDWNRLWELVGPYDITVDGVTFKSDEDKEADDGSWRYVGSGKQLQLNDYHGGAIRSDGDLSIFSDSVSSESIVSATDTAISIKGLASLSGSDLTVRSSQGNGIEAQTVSLWVEELSVFGGSRGYGIYADDITVGESCSISGGIYFTADCYFAPAEITVQGVIQGNGTSWRYNAARSSYAVSGDTLTISPLAYTTTLYGNGGTNNGQTSMVIKTAYSDSTGSDLDLYENQFQRNNYVQVGWSESANGKVDYSLDNWVHVEQNLNLYAVWAAAKAGEIVLITDWTKIRFGEGWTPQETGTKFSNGNIYQKLSGSSVKLPTTLVSVEDNSPKEVVAWRDSYYRWYADPGYSGTVYAAGTTIKSDPSTTRVLFPVVKEADGRYCFYHLNGATNSDGSDLLLDTRAGWSMNPERIWDYGKGEYITVTPPEGKMFAGWSTSSGSTTVAYKASEQMDMEPGQILHLYAVWVEDTRIQLEPPTDLQWGVSYWWKTYDKDAGKFEEERELGYRSGRASCLTPEVNQHRYRFVFYRANPSGPDIVVDETGYNEYDKITTPHHIFLDIMDIFTIYDLEPGDYYFTVVTCGDGTQYLDSESVRSPIWHYTEPKKQLPTPSKPAVTLEDVDEYDETAEKWVTRKGRCWVWQSEETWYSSSFDKLFYVDPILELQYATAPDGDYRFVSRKYASYSTKMPLANMLEDSWTGRFGTGYYQIRVRSGVVSDLSGIRASTWSEWSDPIYYSKELDEVKETMTAPADLPDTAEDLTDAQRQTVAETIESIKAVEDKQAMVTAMNSDSAVVESVEKLEKLAGKTAEVSVADEVTDIDQSKVGVVGAGLNGTAEQEVVLKITEVAKDAPVREELYKDTVQFSMDLVDKNTAEVISEAGEQLDVPVMIRLPIPAKINPAFLVILHYRENGTYEEVWPTIEYDSGQWYAKFVVTHFSDFVLAEMKAQGTDTGVDLTLQLSETLKEQATSAYCAVYDAHNKMLGVATPLLLGGKQTVSIPCKAPETADHVKVILLNYNMAPVGGAQTVPVMG